MNTIQFKYTMQMYELRNSRQNYFYFVVTLVGGQVALTNSIFY